MVLPLIYRRPTGFVVRVNRRKMKRSRTLPTLEAATRQRNRWLDEANGYKDTQALSERVLELEAIINQMKNDQDLEKQKTCGRAALFASAF